MGLDMYAMTIDKRLIDDTDQVAVAIGRKARRAVGFLDLSEAELKLLSEDGRKHYYDKMVEADTRAIGEGFIDTNFAYWRKFNNLHGWMERLYRFKDGINDFNCVNVRLDSADLDQLESDAKNKTNLESTAGFFFGSASDFSDEDQQEVLQFVAKARQAIAEGKAVFYDSWW